MGRFASECLKDKELVNAEHVCVDLKRESERELSRIKRLIEGSG